MHMHYNTVAQDLRDNEGVRGYPLTGPMKVCACRSGLFSTDFLLGTKERRPARFEGPAGRTPVRYGQYRRLEAGWKSQSSSLVSSILLMAHGGRAGEGVVVSTGRRTQTAHDAGLVMVLLAVWRS